jgi:hypothetical protein
MLDIQKIIDPGVFNKGPRGSHASGVPEILGLPFRHAAYTFGIELETFNGNFRLNPVTSKGDGSIRGPGDHVEFVSPILLGDKGLYFAAKMVNSIREHGAGVNDSTGFHVHVGGSNCSIDASKSDNIINESACLLVNNFQRIQDWAFSMNEDASRRTRSYSGALNTSMIPSPTVRYSDAQSRRALRFTQHSTVEFRSAQGLLDHKVAVAWILACLAQVSLADNLVEVHHPSQLLVFWPELNDFIQSNLNIPVLEHATAAN